MDNHWQTGWWGVHVQACCLGSPPPPPAPPRAEAGAFTLAFSHNLAPYALVMVLLALALPRQCIPALSSIPLLLLSCILCLLGLRGCNQQPRLAYSSSVGSSSGSSAGDVSACNTCSCVTLLGFWLDTAQQAAQLMAASGTAGDHTPADINDLACTLPLEKHEKTPLPSLPNHTHTHIKQQHAW